VGESGQAQPEGSAARVTQPARENPRPYETALSAAAQATGLLAAAGTIILALRVLVVARLNMSVARALLINSSLVDLASTVALDAIIIGVLIGVIWALMSFLNRLTKYKGNDIGVLQFSA
jgi:hypothetical protein